MLRLFIMKVKPTVFLLQMGIPDIEGELINPLILPLDRR